jgi:hypothetical protein
VRSAIVVAAVATCHLSYAGPAKPANRTMTYDEAVALLQVPQRWCELPPRSRGSGTAARSGRSTAW